MLVQIDLEQYVSWGGKVFRCYLTLRSSENEKARNFSRSFGEVLLEGEVPLASVIGFYETEPFADFLAPEYQERQSFKDVRTSLVVNGGCTYDNVTYEKLKNYKINRQFARASCAERDCPSIAEVIKRDQEEPDDFRVECPRLLVRHYDAESHDSRYQSRSSINVMDEFTSPESSGTLATTDDLQANIVRGPFDARDEDTVSSFSSSRSSEAYENSSMTVYLRPRSMSLAVILVICVTRTSL